MSDQIGFPKKFYVITVITLAVGILSGYVIALNTQLSGPKFDRSFDEFSSNISIIRDEFHTKISEIESKLDDIKREQESIGEEVKGAFTEISTLDEQLKRSNITLFRDLFERYAESVVSLTVGIVQNGQIGYSMGSGFVYDSGGYIVTNYHVIMGFEASIGIEVEFQDGTIVKGGLVAADPDSDLAVLKVNLPEEIRALNIGNSSKVEAGDLIVAIGNPFGLGGTITSGIVSQIDRSITTESGFLIPNVIQFDAAVNPGNSGGPILNMDGEVIGITTSGLPKAFGEGISFAISSNTVSRVVPPLIMDGYYNHVYIGIAGRQVNLQIAEAMNLNTTQGVLVTSVAEGSPADEAGLRGGDQIITVSGELVPIGGDVITHIDGVKMVHFIDIVAYVEENKRPGDLIEITALSHGKKILLPLTLGER